MASVSLDMTVVDAILNEYNFTEPLMQTSEDKEKYIDLIRISIDGILTLQCILFSFESNGTYKYRQ